MIKSGNNDGDKFKVSVVIPLFNKEDSIGRSVDSVLNQIFPVEEIIIVDDGSTDTSIEVLNEFNDPRIKILKQENSGPSSARNTGIRHAKSPWITFLDADDTWKSDYLQQIDKLHSLCPECGVLTSFYEITRENDNQDTKYFSGTAPNWAGKIPDYYSFREKGIFHHIASTVCRKSDLNSVNGFREGIHHFEDFLLWLDLAAITGFAFINEPLAVYHSSRFGLSKRPFSLENQLTPSELIDKQFAEGKIRLDFIKSAGRLREKFLLLEAMLQFNQGNKTKALKMFSRRKNKKIFRSDWIKFLIYMYIPSWIRKNFQKE